MMETLQIVRGTLENLNDISELFSDYREFYGIESNKLESMDFIKSRLTNDESVIFIAYDNHIACGFVQVYFSFSSLSISPIIILNDLYVSEKYRKKGIATQLMKSIKDFAVNHNFSAITLCTSQSNKIAQSLYVKEGYKIDDEFVYYSFKLK